MRRRVVLVSAFLGALMLVASACDGPPVPRGGGQPGGMAAHSTRSARFAREVGPTAPTTTIRFDAVLRMPGAKHLARYLERVNDPSSPLFGRSLTSEELGARFGLPLSLIADAEARFREAGFRVAGANSQRTALGLSGTAGAIGRLFGIRLTDFRDPAGRLFHRPVGPAVVPPSLRPAVVGVAGLDTGPVPVFHAIPAHGLKPDDVAKAYDIERLHEMGIEGQGQTVAVIITGHARDQEISKFEKLTGTSGPRVRHIAVNGGSSDTTGPGAGEANLDVDVIRGVAPQAQILSYEFSVSDVSSFYLGMAAAVDRIVSDGKADIVSMSMGLCDEPKLSDGESWISPADRLRVSRAFQGAEAAGISVFVSAGDEGAYECESVLPSDKRPTVALPGDLPSVISVGGTFLSVREDGSYLEEAGWEDIFENSGTGGGLNPRDARPSWQVGPGVDNQYSNGKRQLPDVSASSDPDSGFFVVGPHGKGSELQQVGGTSAATPFWAASLTLVEQYAQQHGIPRLGFAAPMLYQIAQQQDPAAPSFHDVTLGGNRLHDCTPGWDFATGLGSPDVFNLADDVVAYLQKNPPA